MFDELGVTEGRAYHAGDVVLLRSKTPLNVSARERIHATLAQLEEKSGVTFVMLEANIEVVEPRDEAQ